MPGLEVEQVLEGQQAVPSSSGPSLYLGRDREATRMAAWRWPGSRRPSVSGHVGAMCPEQML